MRKERIQARLELVKQRLQMYYAAEAAILQGSQSYSIAGRSLTRANLAQIREEIDNLERQQDELENALTGSEKRKAYRILYRDL